MVGGGGRNIYGTPRISVGLRVITSEHVLCFIAVDGLCSATCQREAGRRERGDVSQSDVRVVVPCGGLSATPCHHLVEGQRAVEEHKREGEMSLIALKFVFLFYLVFEILYTKLTILVQINK